MNQETYEQVGKFYSAFNEPLQKMLALNMKSFKKASELVDVEQFLKAKNPDDLLAVQKEIATKSSLHVLEYWQESLGIWEKSAESFQEKEDQKKSKK